MFIWHTFKRRLIIGVYAQGDNPYKVNIDKVLDSILGTSFGYSIFVQYFEANSKYCPKIFHSHVLTIHCITLLYMLHTRSCHADREAATTVIIEYFPISWVAVSLWLMHRVTLGQFHFWRPPQRSWRKCYLWITQDRKFARVFCIEIKLYQIIKIFSSVNINMYMVWNLYLP